MKKDAVVLANLKLIEASTNPERLENFEALLEDSEMVSIDIQQTQKKKQYRPWIWPNNFLDCYKIAFHFMSKIHPLKQPIEASIAYHEHHSSSSNDSSPVVGHLKLIDMEGSTREEAYTRIPPEKLADFSRRIRSLISKDTGQ